MDDADAPPERWVERHPLSSYGARVAVRMRADRLERMYGGGLAVLGFVLLAGSLI